jgi:hypothetical protein
MKWMVIPLLGVLLIAGCTGIDSVKDESNIDMKVNALTKSVARGNYLEYNVTILLNNETRADVPVNYTVISEDSGDIIYESSEFVAVSNSLMFSRKVLIASGTISGLYAIEVRALYGRDIVTSTDSFEVV